MKHTGAVRKWQVLCEDILLCVDAFANYSSIGTVQVKKIIRAVPTISEVSQGKKKQTTPSLCLNKLIFKVYYLKIYSAFLLVLHKKCHDTDMTSSLSLVP